MSFNRSQLNRVKLFLLVTMFLVFGVVLTIFIGYRTISNPEDLVLSSVIRDEAAISIGRVHQTSTKDGIKEWSLDAASAQFLEEDRQAIFDDLSVVFYLESGQTVKLSAAKGYLNTETRDILIDGNVVAEEGGFRIQTETLDYNHAARVLVARKQVKITGRAFRLNADSALFDMTSQTATLDGSVEGFIFNAIDL